mmetsp:Transcript_39251/g.111119  ORF Transcript_39251/g.111119 Transcript_39251/m.111119 type:complete len:590 (-) Transcript_39251:291-2060(-)
MADVEKKEGTGEMEMSSTVSIPAGAPETMEKDGSEEKTKCMSKKVWIGDYDYSYLCLPVLNPWGKSSVRDLPFYGPNELLPVLLCVLMGFQHSLSMGGGITPPPLLVGLADPSEGKQYQAALISYSLIVSGLTTIVQVTCLKIPKTPYQLGSGLLSVMGTSFTFLPIVQGAVATQMEAGVDFNQAYGNMLGVFMVGAFVEAAMSFIPTRILRSIFPPYISGLTIFLIGASLIGSGVRDWGGGTFCQQNPGFSCSVGDSRLTYGSASYWGLGFFVVVVTLLLELFGSPFMRSCQVALGLLVGYILAAATEDYMGNRYVTFDSIKNAPVITFLWTTPFPVGFYAPALLPVLIGFVVSGVETIGDLTATGEASGLEPGSIEQARAVQGGLLGDSVNSFFAAVAFTMPNTTFSQNNGVVSLTRVASRLAGFGCAMWLLFFGIFGKVGAFFTSIPPPILGGMTTVLFANIAMSGIKVITSVPMTRRIRFIVAISMAFGLGVTIVPDWTANLLPCDSITNGGLAGLCSGAELTISTGYAIGCLSALILHAIMPSDVIESSDADPYMENVRAPSQEDMAHLGGDPLKGPLERLNSH